ncbi:MAG TPA: hypothetical protein PKG57_13370, partial [Flavobacteriales bacterium]|nr:hypothetical protein [Flavobacteriales bacterium]
MAQLRLTDRTHQLMWDGIGTITTFWRHVRSIGILTMGMILLGGAARAQVPTSVDIDLQSNPAGDSLRVYLTPHGSDFSQVVSAVTFSLRWSTSDPATIAARTSTCTGIPFNAGTTATDGGYNYRIYSSFGLSSLQTEGCTLWTDGVPVLVLKIKVEDLDGCTPFEIVNDGYTGSHNANLYISLNGLDRTGVIEPTEAYLNCCVPPTIDNTSSNSPVCLSETLMLSVLASGTGPLSYSWTGDGTIVDGNTPSATVTGGSTGDYNITVSNLCGSINQDVPVTVNDPDDGDPCTLDLCSNGVVDNPPDNTDTDGDGTIDCQDDCPTVFGFQGDPCDDGDPCTQNDQLNGNCDCAGTLPSAYWNFGTSSGNASASSVTLLNATVSTITRGNNNGSTPLLTSAAQSSGYSGSSGQYNAGAATINGPLNPTTSTYFEVTVTPGPGYIFTLSELNFGTRSTTTGAQLYSIRTNLDGYSTTIASGPIANNSSWSLKTNSGLSTSSLVGQPLTIRIYGSNGSGALGGTAVWRIDDVTIVGCSTCENDTDGDGVCDMSDNCVNDSNVDQDDTDGDGIGDVCDPCDDNGVDTDNDGTADCNELCPLDPAKTAPGICGCGVADDDSDTDGTADCNDGCPNDPNKIAPGICGCDVADTDSDGDGAADCNDLCPADPNKIVSGICGCGAPDTDSDGDGTADCMDGCPNDPNKIAPGVCGCDVADTDSDGDGTADCNDLCPADPNKIVSGICGCGVPDTDSDGDSTADCMDGCPNDPNKIAPGVCGCDVADTDSDGDGYADCHDGCPNDPNKIVPGICGCDVADTDSDGDGTADCNDGCPNDPLKIASGICGCGVPDTDSDGDGTADCNDGCP